MEDRGACPSTWLTRETCGDGTSYTAGPPGWASQPVRTWPWSKEVTVETLRWAGRHSLLPERPPPATQHPHAPLPGGHGQLLGQPRLAGPRLPTEQRHQRFAGG